LEGAGERPEPVAHGGGLLVALGRGEAAHPRLERSEEPVRGLEGGEEIPDELSAVRSWLARNPVRLVACDTALAEPVEGGATIARILRAAREPALPRRGVRSGSGARID
jgi:hypothetical protein